MRIKSINPVAKALLQSRRRTQQVPDKTKYNRTKDNQSDANQAGKHEEPKDN
jgi:hypothetical protein